MSRWTHAACQQCYPDATGMPAYTAVRVVDADPEPCCLCEQITRAGLYFRGDPATVPCSGVHNDDG